MYIPEDLINLILSFVDKCNHCQKIIIDEEYYNDYNDCLICFRCKDCFKICQTCRRLYDCSIYCRFCMGICKYLCKKCLPPI